MEIRDFSQWIKDNSHFFKHDLNIQYNAFDDEFIVVDRDYYSDDGIDDAIYSVGKTVEEAIEGYLRMKKCDHKNKVNTIPHDLFREHWVCDCGHDWYELKKPHLVCDGGPDFGEIVHDD